MTPFRWALLCLLFTLYLLFGGSIFMLIEQHHEIHQKEELHVLRQDIQEILFRLDHNFYSNLTSPDVLEALTTAKEGVINRIAAVCGLDNLLEDTGGHEPSSLKWNYYNSVFFAFTVVTTIGYGHLSPSTSLSKTLMMVYALFGIPLNGILLSGVGDYFSNKLVKVHQKSKDKQYRGKTLTLIFEIIFYLIPGIVVFIIIPAGIFVLIENWTFLDSVYFAFVSLTTIGFGDYVAGMGDGHNIWLWLYKAFIIIWITFGLGYLIMILGFIAKGMKSKKVRGVLEKRLTGIRNTKEKLSKDIDYMRRIVNELYLMKIKPVYDLQDQGQDNPAMLLNGSILGIRHRRPSFVQFDRKCNSLPRLPIYVNGEPQLPGGIPYFITSKHQPLRRRHSESDLSRVNRDETFANLKNASMNPDELLSTVVNALSGHVMQDVMNAVDELNKYEQEVEDEKQFGPAKSPDESGSDDQQRRISSGSDASTISDNLTPNDTYGAAHPWELDAVSESDEEVLIDDDGVKKSEPQLESVLVHNLSVTDSTDKKSGQSQSFIEIVSGAIRKISGTVTPPETPSRKISRNESDKKRKISREPERVVSSGGILRNPLAYDHNPTFSHYNNFNHTQGHQNLYSPFTRRPSSIRRQMPETEAKYAKNPSRKNSEITRKISQESRTSNASTAWHHQSIDEIMSSVRANRSRKTTPAHYHPSSPIPSGDDQVDSSVNSDYGHGINSLEASTSSLAQFLRHLDNVQDRLKKTSACSDASFSGSYLSTYGTVDLSNASVTGSMSRPIDGHGFRKYSMSTSTTLSPDSVDRKRKNGVFQPGFSYVNFGYHPEEEDNDEERAKKLMLISKNKLSEKNDDQDFLKSNNDGTTTTTNNNNNNNNPPTSQKKR